MCNTGEQVSLVRKKQKNTMFKFSEVYFQNA